jgi:hypothetical protein
MEPEGKFIIIICIGPYRKLVEPVPRLQITFI